MATELLDSANIRSRFTSADLSTKQFYAVKEGTTNRSMALVAAVTDRPLGILQDKPKANQAGAVAVAGQSKAVSDGTTTIAIGDLLGCDTSGRVVKNTTADRPVIGRALEPSTAAGVIISIEIMPVGVGVFRTPA